MWRFYGREAAYAMMTVVPPYAVTADTVSFVLLLFRGLNSNDIINGFFFQKGDYVQEQLFYLQQILWRRWCLLFQRV